jgi:serine/threonine-protein kinase
MPASEPDGVNRANLAPRVIGGYRLLRQIGHGGMSTVYLSYDVTAGHQVAVKVLADHLATSREFVTRFYREARLSRLLAHPNLVRGLAAGYDPDARKHYLVLEFIDGPTTHSVLAKNGKLPLGVVVKAGIDIARALEFLHSRKYVHRDVKPDNILLHPFGVAKLADMGLAKRLNEDPQLTSVNLGLGTSYYMAYEQALNADFVDGRSDIYALGATLYHLITGEVPFPGKTHDEIMRGKQRNAFVPVRDLNPQVPPRLGEIIERTLLLDPCARFQSASELGDFLEATGLATAIPPFHGETATTELATPDNPTRADLSTPVPGTTTNQALARTTASYPANTAPRPNRQMRKRTLIALGILAGTAIAAVGAGALFSSRATEEREPNVAPNRHRDLPDANPGGASLKQAQSR